MDKITVSIIVPIYNVEPYLSECLESLKRQTLKNIEIIMVNDGSTDNSASIARQYAEANDNFILVNRDNGGLSAARNTGLEHATGKYILFLDSDDYITDNALEILYKTCEEKSMDLLHFVAYTFTDVNKELVWDRENGYKYNGQYPEIYTGLDLLQLFIDNNDTAYPSCCMILIKHDVIRHYDLTFCEGIIHEDNLFHLQLVAACKRTGVLNQPLYCRRIRENSITQTVNYKKKIYSMYVSSIEADNFFSIHPELKSNAVCQYIGGFMYFMMIYWQKMGTSLRTDSEIKDYYKRIKPLARKYKYNHSKRLFLFTLSKTLFYFFQ